MVPGWTGPAGARDDGGARPAEGAARRRGLPGAAPMGIDGPPRARAQGVPVIAVEAIGGASHVSPRVPGEAPGAGAARDPLSRPARPFVEVI